MHTFVLYGCKSIYSSIDMHLVFSSRQLKLAAVWLPSKHIRMLVINANEVVLRNRGLVNFHVRLEWIPQIGQSHLIHCIRECYHSCRNLRPSHSKKKSISRRIRRGRPRRYKTTSRPVSYGSTYPYLTLMLSLVPYKMRLSLGQCRSASCLKW